MNKMKIKELSIFDKNYPEYLKNVSDPPIKLYVLGNESILNKKKIAIVGCREYSEYGKECAKYFSSKLTKKNFVIISGLAKRNR